MFDVVEMR